MKVCVVGGGGREHALALALARTAEVVLTPGSPGMAGSCRGDREAGAPLAGSAFGGPGERISVTGAPPEEVDAELFVIGPEAHLVDGLADRLRSDRRLVVGPGADGARLEGSKAFMKELLAEAGVPSARFGVFDDLGEARELLRSLPGPYVVKTDGLAAGKGVLVTESLAEAAADAEAKLSGRAFGDAGRRVVIEEGLSGEECSLMVLCDGSRVAPLAPARDFKRVGDGDTGPNTGGMGAYSPLSEVGDDLVGHVMEVAVEPLVGALRRRGIDYRGVLYAGLMLTDEGPKVLEYNVRFGDPEAQVVLPRFEDDLTGILAEVASGRLRSEPRFSVKAAVCVVLASGGYPTSPATGDVVEGLGDAAAIPGVSVLHAGTDLDSAGRVVTAGGRVVDVVALAPSLPEARSSAYEAAARIHWKGMIFRSDIAAEAAARGTAAEAAARGTAAGAER